MTSLQLKAGTSARSVEFLGHEQCLNIAWLAWLHGDGKSAQCSKSGLLDSSAI